MSINYWIEQHNKEALAIEIKKFLDEKYDGIYHPSMINELSKEISLYMKTHDKTRYKVYIKLSFEDNSLSIEIP